MTPANRALAHQRAACPELEMPLRNRFDSRGVSNGADSPSLST